MWLIEGSHDISIDEAIGHEVYPSIHIHLCLVHCVWRIIESTGNERERETQRHTRASGSEACKDSFSIVPTPQHQSGAVPDGA